MGCEGQKVERGAGFSSYVNFGLGADGTVGANRNSITIIGEEAGPSAVLTLGESGRALLYVGPKDYHVLSQAGRGLAAVMLVLEAV